MIMNTPTIMEIKMIDKKIRCIHCNQEIVVNPLSTIVQKCHCGKLTLNNGIITEGAQGVDWVDISPQLLNE